MMSGMKPRGSGVARPGLVVLRPLTLDDEQVATAAHEECSGDGFAFLLDRERSDSWADYIARLEITRHGIDLPPDRVPATFLVAEAHGLVVGRVSLRHQLTAFLYEVGGHIGYAVRPGYRRRGYATEICRQTLERASELELGRVLITCDDDNDASATVIERCGGVLDNVVAYGSEGAFKRRYWVSTANE